MNGGGRRGGGIFMAWTLHSWGLVRGRHQAKQAILRKKGALGFSVFGKLDLSYQASCHTLGFLLQICPHMHKPTLITHISAFWNGDISVRLVNISFSLFLTTLLFLIYSYYHLFDWLVGCLSLDLFLSTLENSISHFTDERGFLFAWGGGHLKTQTAVKKVILTESVC